MNCYRYFLIIVKNNIHNREKIDYLIINKNMIIKI